MPQILQKQDLPGLAKWLEQYLPKSCKMLATVQASIQDLFLKDYWVDKWPEVTCVIAKDTESNNSSPVIYGIFRSDPRNLAMLLEYPGVINWSDTSIYAAWPCEDSQVLAQAGLKHNCEIEVVCTGDIYMFDTDITTTLEVPVGMRLGRLLPEHARLVKETWEHGYTSSVSYIRDLIQHLPTACLYDENGKPIGFELTREYGSMGTLYVTPEHRKKGFAKLITLSLAHQLTGLGRLPYVFIMQSNEPSLRLHQTLGFQKLLDNKLVWMISNGKAT